VIGDLADAHVIAVLRELGDLGVHSPLVLDSPALQAQGFSLTLDQLHHAGISIELDDPFGTGWLRRYAPSGWGTGTIAGSLEAVSRRAFLALVGAITRLGNRRWLTPLDAMLKAEDRLVQLDVARALGIRVPQTIVTSDPDAAEAMLGRQFVVKPISGGYFWTASGARTVFTSLLEAHEAQGLDFAAAPFIAQQWIDVSTHLRVVTVGSKAWVCELEAKGRPIDWRQQEEAHFSWRATEDPELGQRAVGLARELGAGYSSQDWVRDDEGSAFLDLNPGGQWLFMPNPPARSITRAIASFLAGGAA